MAADVNQLMSVSSEGLGLILIKLFLVNINNINNHSVNLDNHKSDFEPVIMKVIMYVDCFPRVTWFYHVLRPSSVYFSIRH